MKQLSAFLFNLMNFLISFGDKSKPKRSCRRSDNKLMRVNGIESYSIKPTKHLSNVKARKKLTCNSFIPVVDACTSKPQQMEKVDLKIKRPLKQLKNDIFTYELTTESCLYVSGGLPIKPPRFNAVSTSFVPSNKYR
ncbi:hypothetical protein [Pseudoalteromonas sp. T1lg23B]|uniref:hypothetical protein n=1 Tax=Pseudoalteromonas sp. T1lg23B TaxID=2077097 RepID=UPI000CF6F3A8|nr:hypothetical protein [Pseudoalteromonas sp. T1lg23B]